MNVRDSLQQILHFERPDRVVQFECGYWPETIARWRDEGMPEVQPWDEVDITFYHRVPAETRIYPPFTTEILEKTEHGRIVRDSSGVVKEEATDATALPRYIRHGKRMKDFSSRFVSTGLTTISSGIADSPFSSSIRWLYRFAKAAVQGATMEYDRSYPQTDRPQVDKPVHYQIGCGQSVNAVLQIEAGVQESQKDQSGPGSQTCDRRPMRSAPVQNQAVVLCRAGAIQFGRMKNRPGWSGRP